VIFMEINWTQIILQGFATGVGAGFATIVSFIVLRYFPKFWEAFEKLLKAMVQDATKENTKPDPVKEADHVSKLVT
jgi:hypothetical protein